MCQGQTSHTWFHFSSFLHQPVWKVPVIILLSQMRKPQEGEARVVRRGMGKASQAEERTCTWAERLGSPVGRAEVGSGSGVLHGGFVMGQPLGPPLWSLLAHSSHALATIFVLHFPHTVGPSPTQGLLPGMSLHFSKFKSPWPFKAQQQTCLLQEPVQVPPSPVDLGARTPELSPQVAGTESQALPRGWHPQEALGAGGAV